MTVKLNRLLQIPVDDIQFSKNLFDITVEAETLEEAQDLLDR